MSPSVVWIVAEDASAAARVTAAGAAAIDCSSRVGRSLKMSRSLDFELLSLSVAGDGVGSKLE
jgi:hypothetical protein